MALFVSSYQPTDGVPVSSVSSRLDRRRLRADRRLDIFWQLAAQEWSTVWAGRSTVERLLASGRRPPARYRLSLTPKDAMAALWDCRRGAPRFVRLRALSAIYHWRVVTTEQVATLVGTPSIDGDLNLLWQAGLVQRGEVVRSVLGEDVPTPELWRIAPGASIRAFLRAATPWERYGLLAGAGWELKSTTPLHDLLVTDVTLRVAELVPEIAAVYGERLSSADRLTGLSAVATKYAHADAVWVRSDGLRIVVELSVSSYQKALIKAERWAHVLQQTDRRDLFILFLVATNPRHRSRSFGWALNAYHKAVADAAWSSLAAIEAGVPERMGVASLADWAPGQMEVAPDFPRLPVWRPTGPREDRFEPADLADPYQVFFDAERAGPDVLAPICWAPLAYAMPWWLARDAVPSALEHLPPMWRLGLPTPSG